MPRVLNGVGTLVHEAGPFHDALNSEALDDF